MKNVLFLCTGNSARSIVAESLLNQLGRDRYAAYSAGSHPTGTVHPLTFEVLRLHGIPTEGLRSKSWDEFARPDAPRFTLVVTVCDNAAGEVCPIWPGAPAKAHWSFQDPAAVTGSGEEQRRAFECAYEMIRERIELFLWEQRG